MWARKKAILLKCGNAYGTLSMHKWWLPLPKPGSVIGVFLLKLSSSVSLSPCSSSKGLCDCWDLLCIAEFLPYNKKYLEATAFVI